MCLSSKMMVQHLKIDVVTAESVPVPRYFHPHLLQLDRDIVQLNTNLTDPRGEQC
jgi:hypothetical protein